MNTYKVEYSYLRENGKRVHEHDTCFASRAYDAAEDIRAEYSDLAELRIEHVWIDTGRAWESREFDY